MKREGVLVHYIENRRSFLFVLYEKLDNLLHNFEFILVINYA